MDPGIQDFVVPYPEEYYGKEEAKFTGIAGRVRSYFHRKRAFRIAGMLPPQGRLYDIGCGDGLFLWHATRYGLSAYGSERETKPRTQSFQNLGFHVDQISFANKKKGEFDGVTCWQVIEHVSEPIHLVRSAHKYLKHNGIFAVSTVNAASWQSKLFRSCWLHLDPPRHSWCGSMEHLEKILASEGFKLERRRSNWIEFGPIGWICSFMNWLGLPRDVFLHKLKCGFRTPFDPVLLLAGFLMPLGFVLSGLEAFSGRPATFELYFRKAK